MTFAEEARFWAKVDRSGGPEACWLWLAGVRNDDGYGQFRLGGRMQQAHRIAYEQANGPIPDGLHVLHRCDVRRCVNPGHLFIGTNADNMADRNAKGRQSRGAKHSSACRATTGRPKTSPRASQYRGVSWNKDAQRWEARIHVAGRKLHLGYFVDEPDASAAYQRAVNRVERGESPL